MRNYYLVLKKKNYLFKCSIKSRTTIPNILKYSVYNHTNRIIGLNILAVMSWISPNLYFNFLRKTIFFLKLKFNKMSITKIFILVVHARFKFVTHTRLIARVAATGAQNTVQVFEWLIKRFRRALSSHRPPGVVTSIR